MNFNSWGSAGRTSSAHAPENLTHMLAEQHRVCLGPYTLLVRPMPAR